MINVQPLKKNTGNLYILFGYEAIQARPNLDPFTSTLRTNDETMQIYTSDVHIKHHARRGIKAYALEKKIPGAASSIFYEKEDEEGNPLDLAKRLRLLREAHHIGKKEENKKDALHYCLDLPLFGYVHAVAKEKFNVTNAINTLFRPITFHACNILPLGRNNAFPTLNKEGDVKESAGSATVDSLEYGFFLALWEVNLSMLHINAKDHKVLPWESTGAKGWLEVFLNGLWKAYSSDRFPSFTQRSQFAQFIAVWQPEKEVCYDNPADLFYKLESKQIKHHHDAITALNSVLPGFLNGWDCTSETVIASHKAVNCPISCLD